MENLTPTAVEQKYFKVPDPDRDEKEVIFTFHFSILPTPGKPQVSFSLWLNQTLQSSGTMSAEEEEPILYHFQRDSCVFHHTTPEEYYLKGRINIVYMSGSNGQFFDDHCNFNFDITYGKRGGTEHDLMGVYPLLDADAFLAKGATAGLASTPDAGANEARKASVLASAEGAQEALTALTEVIGTGEGAETEPSPETLLATWEAAQNSAPLLQSAMDDLVSAVSTPETLLGSGELHAHMQQAVNTVTETLSTVAGQLADSDLNSLTEQQIPVMEIIRPELEVSIQLRLWALTQTPARPTVEQEAEPPSSAAPVEVDELDGTAEMEATETPETVSESTEAMQEEAVGLEEESSQATEAEPTPTEDLQEAGLPNEDTPSEEKPSADDPVEETAKPAPKTRRKKKSSSE